MTRSSIRENQYSFARVEFCLEYCELNTRYEVNSLFFLLLIVLHSQIFCNLSRNTIATVALQGAGKIASCNSALNDFSTHSFISAILTRNHRHILVSCITQKFLM